MLTCAGYVLGENWHVIEDYMHLLDYIIIIILLTFLSYLVVTRRRAKSSQLD